MSNNLKHLLAALIIGIAPYCVSAQTATNDCAYDPGNQYTVGSSCSLVAFNKPDAFNVHLVASGCSAGNRDDAWGWFTATSNVTNLTYDPAASQRPIMHVYSGACGSLTQEGCVNAGSNGANANLTIATNPGQNYMVRIQLHNSSTAMNGSFCAWSPAAPANDNPCGAVSLAVNSSCTNTTSTNVGATGTAGVPGPGCGAYVSGDVWFSFVAPAGGSVTVETSSSGGLTDTGLAIYEAPTCSTGFALIECNDDGAGLGLFSRVSRNGLTPGATYYARVWGYNNAAGGFNICAFAPTAPANDNPCASVLLTVNASCTNTTATNIGATATAGIPAPGCGNYTGGDVWFSFVAPASGRTSIQTSSSGGLANTAIALYSATNCSSGFALIVCDDDAIGFFSLIDRVGLTPGATYYVRAWGVSGSAGTFNICAYEPAIAPPSNDVPCGAIDIALGTSCTFSARTNAGALHSSGIPAPGCGNYEGRDVWFRFTAPANGLATFRVNTGTLANPAMALYQASSCSGPFTLIACDNTSGPGDAPFMTLTPLEIIPGETYYLRVWGNSGTTGTFDLCGYTAPSSGDCIYVLRMWDSQGDGWGNSRVTIQVGAGPATNYWNANADEDVAYISVSVGQSVTVSYATGGSGGQGQIRYALQLINGPLYMDGPTPGTGPRWAGTANCQSASSLPSDCIGGAAICNAQQISANPSNTGLTQDLNQHSRGCLGSNERQGYWYRFNISGSGLLGFTISPNDPNDDYDFGIWGPFSSLACPPRQAPVRCNYSGTPDDTGLSALGTSSSEGGSGNKWSSRMPVTVGEIFLMYVSNFSQSGLAFDLTWQLENGASLDCTLLPIQLLSLTGAPVPDGIRLDWSTATESNSAAFAIERMNEFGDFEQIGELPAAGNSISLIDYQFVDSQPLQGFNHYRLKMIDSDGSAELSHVVSVANRYGGFVGLFPNPATDHISIVMDELPVGEIAIRFHDASGRLVREQRTAIGEGQTSVTIPLLGMDPGQYALSYSLPNSAMRYGGRFLVQ